MGRESNGVISLTFGDLEMSDQGQLLKNRDDATEGVAKHSSRLQPSINLHAPVKAFMFSCSGTMYYPRGMKARISPVQ